MRPSGIALSANHEIYVTNQSMVGGGSARAIRFFGRAAMANLADECDRRFMQRDEQ